MSEPSEDASTEPVDPLSLSIDLSKPIAATPLSEHRSFSVLAKEDEGLPEIRRLHGLFESLESELLGDDVTHIVGDGDYSDKDSDDGLNKEVRKLPNSSIHDMHTIVTSAKGSRLLVTPNNKVPVLEDDESLKEDIADTALEPKTSPTSLHTTTGSEIVDDKNATPVRVSFDPAQTDESSEKMKVSGLTTSGSGDNTPTRMPTSPRGRMPPSTGAKYGHHGFTPMTLQQLMKMETPESRVDEMLQELYNLMGKYNKEESFPSSSTLNDLDPELSMPLFESPLPEPREFTGSDASGEFGEGAFINMRLEEEILGDYAMDNNNPLSAASLAASSSKQSEIEQNDKRIAHISVVDCSEEDRQTAAINIANTSVPRDPETAPTQSNLKPVQAHKNTTSEEKPGNQAHADMKSHLTKQTRDDVVERSRAHSSSVDIDEDIADILQMSSHRGKASSIPPTELDQSTFKSGWVGINSPSKADENTMKLHESIVHGDFYIWSEGPKLTAEYIAGAYVGMNPTAVTHNNDNGVLVPAQTCKPTTIPGTKIPTGIYANRAAQANTTGVVNDDRSSASQGSPVKGGFAGDKQHPSTHGYYVVYLLECVVRPDVELRQLLASVLKVARTRDCKCYFPHNNHVVLKSNGPPAAILQHQHHQHGHGHQNAPGAGVVQELREWDQIDVQVVLSQEVRQRMLVCQFLRRVPSLASSGFGNLNLIIYQIAGGATPLTLHSSPKTKSFVSKLKRELKENELCLSSLYNVSLEGVCALPQQADGLDAHFRAQLQQQVYGPMWARLEGDIRQMSEHLQVQLKDCHEFVHTLESMYKAYGLPPPLEWKSSSQRHHQQNSLPSPTSPYRSDDPLTPLVKPRRSLPPTPHTDKAMMGNEKHQAMVEGSCDTGATSPTPLRAPLALSDTPVTGSSETPAIANNDKVTNPSAASSGLVTMPFAPSSTPRATDGGHSKVQEDGMTVVLSTMHQTLQDLQDSCDEEYTRRVQLQNEWIVRQVDNMQDYKHSLLFTLASNPDAMDASIMKTFNAQFSEVPTTIDAAGNVSYGAGSRASSASNSRNNSSDAGLGAGLVEASLYNEFKESPAAMKTINLHNERAIGQARSQPVKSAPTAAAPSPGTSNWMTGLTNAFSSFTASYSHAESPAKQTARHHSSDKTADARTQFKPKEQRPKLTQDEVNKRLSEYHTQKSNTPIKSNENNAVIPGGEDEEGDDEKGFTLLSPQSQAASLIALSPVVLYYCSCLISKSPGTIYITPTTICVASNNSLLTLKQNKEVFPISALHDVLLPAQWVGQTGDSSASTSTATSVPMLYSNTLQLVFFKSSGHAHALAHAPGAPLSPGAEVVPNCREVLISPMMLDCVKLRHIILEVRTAFAQVR